MFGCLNQVLGQALAMHYPPPGQALVMQFLFLFLPMRARAILGAVAWLPFPRLRSCTQENPSVTAAFAPFPALIFTSHCRFPPFTPFFSPSIANEARAFSPFFARAGGRNLEGDS